MAKPGLSDDFMIALYRTYFTALEVIEVTSTRESFDMTSPAIKYHYLWFIHDRYIKHPINAILDPSDETP